MPTRSTPTQMDDQMKYQINPKRSPLKGTAPNNYNSITYLPMMWKILTAQMREEIYYSFTSRGLFPEEQKGSSNDPEAQMTCSTLIRTSSTRARRNEKNLAWAWIEYKRHIIWSHKAASKCIKYQMKS